MNLENAFELEIPNGEVKHIAKDGTILWQRAIEKTTEKGGNVSFENTRYAGDGESYPAFPHTQVLPSVKAYGKTIEAKPQEELWGRYAPVEYIESNGNQYITNTYTIPTTATSFDIKTISYTSVGSELCLIGDKSKTLEFGYGSAANRAFFYISKSVAALSTDATIRNRKNEINAHVTTSNYSIDADFPGGSGETSTAVTISGVRGANLNIGTYDTTSTSYRYIGRIYRIQYTTDGVVVRDFIPVKDIINNTYGMWDRIEKKFYGSNGTEAFTGGNEIKRIDYLQSPGTAYIDTEYVSDAETEVEIEASLSAISSGSKYLFGSSGAERFMIAVASASQKFIFDTNSNLSHRVVSTVTADLTKHIHVVKNLSYYIDGVLQGTSSHTPGTLVGTSFLMQARNSSNPGGEWKVYYAKISSNGAEIRDFIPVKIGTTGYMLDLVEWKLYANAGTGDFVCGPEIPNRLILSYKLYGNKGEIKYGWKYNNLTPDPHFEHPEKWDVYSGTGEFKDGAVYITGATGRNGIRLTYSTDYINFITGHKYFNHVEYKCDTTIQVYMGKAPTLNPASDWTTHEEVYTRSDTTSYKNLDIFPSTSGQVGNFAIRNIFCFDLTEIFGAGNEPSTVAAAKAALIGIHADDAHNITLDGVTKSISDLLYSANGYKDLQTGNVYQDFGIKVFDGTESFSQHSVAQGTLFRYQFTDRYREQLSVRSLCNHYQVVTQNSRTNGTVSSSDIMADFIDERFTTAEEFKAYLAEQYANGTPVIIIYPLANPTTTAGTADVFRLTTKGNKTLSSDVAGTGVQATYLGE